MKQRITHVGISVANLERAVQFYTDCFELRVLTQGEFYGDQFAQILKLQNVRGKVALLGSEQLKLELFEFGNPTPRKKDPWAPVNDHGISHFCVEVADILDAYRRMSDAGATFHCPPLRFAGLGLATYGRDPDGNVFELYEPEDGPALNLSS